MRYEVTPGTNEVHIFDNNDIEVVYQPSWPDGTTWGSVEEATSWAAQHVESMLDLTADLAGPSPDFPTITRPVAPALPEIPGVE